MLLAAILFGAAACSTSNSVDVIVVDLPHYHGHRDRLRHLDMPLRDARGPGRVLVQQVGETESDHLGGDNGRELDGEQTKASHRNEIYDDCPTQTDGHSRHG